MMLGEWAIRFSPSPNELLSTWLARSAYAHGLSTYRFMNLLLPGTPIWDRDMDCNAAEHLIERLSAVSRVGILALNNATLQQGCVGSPVANQQCGRRPYILSLGIFHRTRRRHGLQYCPECLRLSEIYQQYWRIGFVVMCPVHRIALHDACPKCDAPIIPHRVKSLRVDRCFRCDGTLISGGKTNDGIPISVIHLQERLLNMYRSVRMTDEYMHLTRTLLSTISNHEKHERLRAYFGLAPHLSKPDTKSLFEISRWAYRVKSLETVAAWVKEWPACFHGGAIKIGLTQRTFVRSRLPSQLADEVKRLPTGNRRNRFYVSLLNTPELKALKRKEVTRYRTRRAVTLLTAMGLR